MEYKNLKDALEVARQRQHIYKGRQHLAYSPDPFMITKQNSYSHSMSSKNVKVNWMEYKT